MPAWSKRPQEIANLFNPAFCGILLRAAVNGYAVGSKNSMPFELSAIVLPIVLHAPTRRTLPTTVRTKFHAWLALDPEVRIGLSERIRILVPYTKEAIIFSANQQLIALGPNLSLSATAKRISVASWPKHCETRECEQRANFVGRWLADSLDVATIYSILGIRP